MANQRTFKIFALLVAALLLAALATGCSSLPTVLKRGPVTQSPNPSPNWPPATPQTVTVPSKTPESVEATATAEKPEPPPPVAKTPQKSQETRTPRSARAEKQRYVLQPQDRIAVVFPYAPSLDQEIVIQPDGMIALPWLPPLRAAGETPSSLESSLRASLARVMHNPRPRVVVRSLGPRFVTVLGAVARPGLVDLRAAADTGYAVEAAGGVREGADRDRVLRIRPGSGPGAALQTTSLAPGSQPLALRHNDVVYVPSRLESSIRRKNRFGRDGG